MNIVTFQTKKNVNIGEVVSLEFRGKYIGETKILNKANETVTIEVPKNKVWLVEMAKSNNLNLEFEIFPIIKTD